MASKLRIKMGIVEFEYEGDAEFTHDSIKDLFSHMETLFSASVLDDVREADLALDAATPLPTGGTQAQINLHTNSIASKLSAKKGPEVALAAAAHLQLVQGKSTFNRQEILQAMKSATSHYKSSMGGNLSAILKTLISTQQVNQIGENSYSLSAAARSELEQKLA